MASRFQASWMSMSRSQRTRIRRRPLSQALVRLPRPACRAPDVFRVAFGDFWFDPEPAQQQSRRVVVVAAIRVGFVRMLLGTAPFAFHFRKFHDDRDDLHLITGIGSAGMQSQWHPVAIHHQGVFAPGFSTVRGVGTGCVATAGRRHLRAVDGDNLQHQLASTVEQLQEFRVQGLPGPTPATRQTAMGGTPDTPSLATHH